MTVRELAAHVGLSRASVHRMLQTLVAIGWADQNTRTARYRLGTGILGLGSAGLIMDPVVQNAKAFLQRLSETTGHTIFLSTLVGARVVYLAKVQGRLGTNSISSRASPFPRTLWRTGSSSWLT